ncbi:acrosomal protein KIAA1210 homolog [Pelodytes ibericus]
MSALYTCLKGKNDSIMAANSSAGPQTLETEDAHEECTGKKKSKFQAFKKLFIKKKRKECPTPVKESNLKPSQSSSDVSVSVVSTTAFHPAQESGPKSNMGNKALSHDSVFIAEPENVTNENSTLETAPGKVKSLQLQLQQNLRIGSSPRGIVTKKLEDSGALSEDDGLPRSPPEINSLHEILAQSASKSSNCAQRRSSLSLGGTDSEEEQVSSQASSRSISPFPKVLSCPTSPASHLLAVDFTTPASHLTCLDNSAAKHRIAIKPKKQRGPARKQMQIAPDQSKETCATSTEKGDDDDDKEETRVEQPRFSEDMVLVVPAWNVKPLRDITEIEGPKVDHEDDVLEVSLPPRSDDERLPPDGEAASCKTDVDSISIPLAKEHSNEFPTEAVLMGEENLQSVETFSTLPQEDATIDIVELSEPNDLKAGMTDSDINSNIACTLLDTSLPIKFNMAMNVPNDPTINEFKAEDRRGQKGLEACLSDKECELTVVIERTLSLNETSLPEVNLSKTEFAEPASVGEKAPECAADESVTFSECRTLDGAEENVDSRTLDGVEDFSEAVESLHTTVCEVNKQARDCSITNPDNDNLDIPEPKVELEKNVVQLDEGAKENCVKKVCGSAMESNKHGSGSVQVASRTACGQIDVLSLTEIPSEIDQEIKSPDSNTECKQKTASGKPVRFTVAPAWQRSISGGSAIKETAFSRNVIKSSSFEGTDEPVAQDGTAKSEKPLQNTRTLDVETAVPFGVRLRSTSTSVKYCEELFGESTTQTLTNTVPLIHSQTSPNPIKSSDIPKQPQLLDTSEERASLKIKTEDSPQKGNSEPAWISMAKQKRKGFQDHLLAKEQNIAKDKDQVKDAAESLLCKSTDNRMQNLEVKGEPKIASTDVPAAPTEFPPEPEKSACPAPSQNSDEPPWMSLAKKKAKAWSEKPQIAQ